MGGNPPNRGPPDEDLLRAVEQKCIEVGAPAVPTAEVEDSDYIDIQQQSIADRLQILAEEGRVGMISAGKGFVWYIPEDEQPDGAVDFSTINWDAIPAKEIPTEKVHQHPEYDNPSYWEKVRDDAEVIARAGFWALVLGAGVSVAPLERIPRVSLTPAQEDFALLAVFFGIVLGVLAIFIGAIATAGESLSEKGVDDWLRDHYSSMKDHIIRWIPVSVSIEWKDAE